MARTLTKDAGPPAGSSPSIPNDEEAVFVSHLNKLRTQQAKVAIKKAELDAERSTLNDLFGLAKADKFTRKELQAILDDGASSRRDLTAEEERRTKLRLWAGLPAGSQADLFALPSPARDEIDAEATGYAMGLRGEDPVMPDVIAPNHNPAFMKGWHTAQEKLAMKLAPEPEKPTGPILVADNDATDAKKPDAA